MIDRNARQAKIGVWCEVAFGKAEAASLPQRGIRLLEEAAEAAQATGVTREMAHRMIEYVWSRPTGELSQEIGGVGVTVLALAEAAGLSAETAERVEVARVLSKPIEHFTRRNAEKNAAGFLARNGETVIIGHGAVMGPELLDHLGSDNAAE